MSYYTQVLTSVGITIIGVLSVYIITGLTGLFSLGQASFMAIGAYTAGLLAKSLGWGFAACALAAVVAGGVAGFLVALPTIRLRRDYIALITFGFGEAVIAVLNNLANITGGATGLISIPRRTTPLLVWGSVVVLIILIWNLKKSRFGRQCFALKSDELTAKSMGINVNRVKLMAFVLASMITAYAGSLYAFHTTYVDPSVFVWNRSAEWLIMLFFGGLGSLTGAVVSGFTLGLLPELLRAANNLRIIIYCLVVLIVINFRPQGMFGAYELNLKRLLPGARAAQHKEVFK